MLRSGQTETVGRTLVVTDTSDTPEGGPRVPLVPASCALADQSLPSVLAPSPPPPSVNQARPRRPPSHTPPPDMESIKEFLKDLPSYDEQNFTLFNTDNGIRTCSKRPSVYLPTTEFPSEQIIVTEKTNILLRYLHQQWEKKNSKKRDGNIDVPGLEECRPKKRPRLNSP